MTPSDYAALDAVGLAIAIQKGEFTSREVTEIAIDVIEQLNPQLNAVIMKNYDNARQAAIDIDSVSPVAGAPLLLKDVNVFSHDMPTTFSCSVFDGAAPKPDSDIVARWRGAGLVVLGKTNTPEFAEDFVTEPTWRGPTLNPWDTALTVGGSSGGAGAAVASGMVPIAHGTDLGGSIRIPAACCGVFGLKPTVGLNPSTPYYPELASGFNSDHVLTRTVRDSAAALDCTARPVCGNRYHVVPEIRGFLDCLEQPPPPLKIAVSKHTPAGARVDGRPGQAVDTVCALLEAAGHTVTAYRYPDGLSLGEWTETLWMLDVYYELEQRLGETGGELPDVELEAMTRYLHSKVENMSAMDHYKARVKAHQASLKLMQSLEDFDLLLTPSLADDPIGVGTLDSRTDAFDFQTWSRVGYEFAPFSQVCNITGQPAASLPVWLPDNPFPSAVQLAGHHRQDHLILQIAAMLEQACEWSHHRPPIWAGSISK